MIISNFASLLVVLLGIVAVIVFPIAAIYLIYKLVAALCWLIWRGVTGIAAGVGYGFRGVGMGASHIFAFVKNTVVDALRLIGAALTSVFMIPPILGNVILGRWSAANHYGRAFESEIKEAWIRFYRLIIGNPIRLIGLKALTEGVEKRLPEVMAHAPGSDHPRGGADRFEGYRITGSLPRGGSGARLYLAEPTKAKYDHFAKNGMVCPGEVVIKAFSLEDGSTLPQIVRESRALTAAKELGLVLDHTLAGENFWYVMPYVDGQDLGAVTRDMHTVSGNEGLDAKSMRQLLQTSAQLLATLDKFHSAGLWHKDIKPGNVIVSTGNQAHLVDFGLVTPLASAMTLTTHGTEYFRDPEMVRLAMQGVKVHEVDGVKFDLYSMGAVLFSMIENSFPAHGNLSQIRKRCPEALRWIVRRSMADTKNRYGSSREMLADVATVLESSDPYDVVPADLPSFGEGASLAGAVDPELYRSSNSPERGIPAFRAEEKEPTTPRKRSRPIQRGVAFAAALLIAILSAGAVFTMSRLPQHEKSLMAAHAQDHTDAVIGRAIDVLETPEEERVRAHLNDHFNSVNAGPGSLEAQIARVSANSANCYLCGDHSHHRPGCKGHAGRPIEFVGVSNAHRSDPYDVLILNDLPPQLSENYLDQISDALSGADMHPRGLANDDEREIEWLASARKAAGVGLSDDLESLERLESFVADNEILDAVLWIMEGEKDGLMISRFVTKDGPVGLVNSAVNLGSAARN